MKKLLFVVIDGGADTPNPEIGNKTAFDAAEIPNMDFLARNGENGVMKILPIPPESDEAVLSLLGYDIFKNYTGRGPIEAIGGGVKFENGNLVLRCNLATVKDGIVKNVRAGYISTSEAKELERAINQYVSLSGAEFVFKITKDYRGVLVIKSKEKLSAKISNTHPGYKLRLLDIVWDRSGDIKYVPMGEAIDKPVCNLQKCMPLESTKSAELSARLVNEFIEKSRLVLGGHPLNKRRISEGKPPANIILVRDAGNKIPKFYNLSKVYGLRWASFVDMPVEKGISQIMGMDIIPLPHLSKDARMDMTVRVLTLLKNWELYDAFYVHLKGPDIFGHMGDIKGKIKSIEDIDKFFFKQLLKNVDLVNTVIVVTCDHTTSSFRKAHTADPVPLTIFGVDGPDNTSYFSEKECEKGKMGLVYPKTLIKYVVNHLKQL